MEEVFVVGSDVWVGSVPKGAEEGGAADDGGVDGRYLGRKGRDGFDDLEGVQFVGLNLGARL